MKVLLTRFGGIGDCFPVMVAARQLKNQGHDVTVALRDDSGKVKQTKMFDNLPGYKFLDLSSVGPFHNRCIEVDGDFLSIEATYKNYDMVIDFVGIVEGNSTSPINSPDPLDFWQRSRSSNWRNWYDLHLEWCNIDPTKVSDECKRPFLELTSEEIEAGKKYRGLHSHLFLIHPYASSLARTWNQAQQLPLKLLEKYPQAKVLFWNPQRNGWDQHTKKGLYPVNQLIADPLRDTMALAGVCDLVIGVDTGVSHIAEALNRKSLIVYSTVPAWTRSKYYKHQWYIDMGEENPEFYTFSLGLGDPLRIKEGRDLMTEREKLIEAMWKRNAPVEEAMVVLNTDMQGAELELNTFMAKQQSWERQQSKSLSLITANMAMEKIEGIING